MDDKRALARRGPRAKKIAASPELVMLRPMKRLLRALAGSAALIAGAAEPAAKFGSLTPGEAVPDFAVTGADGQELKLADFRGRVVVVSFGATNRPPADTLEALAAKYGEGGVAVLGVCAAPTRRDFEIWASRNSRAASYPLAWDPAGAATAERIAKKNFGIAVTPATAVINRAGKLVGGIIGFGAASGPTLRGFLRDAGIAVPADELPPAPAPDSGDENLLKVGTPAPDFTAVDPAGRPVRVNDFAGKIVVLDFWATWCGPCIASMPHTQHVAAATKEQDVVVLASCTSDTRDKFEAWMKQNGATYPDLVFAHDPAGRDATRAAKKLYGVNGIPTQFVIGRDGKVAAVFVGYGEGDTRLEQELKKQGVNLPVEK